MMRVLSLFSGIGGIDLGLERAGMRIVGQVEIDPYCRAVLAKHWPEVPRHDEIRTYAPGSGAADLVAGGPPCQPVSVAGKRGGTGDDRWLWPEMLRVVCAVRPRWVLIENVPGFRTLGADRVLEDLEAEGYANWPLVVGADDAGAPHRRKRVWIVGHAQGHDERRPRSPEGGCAREAGGSGPRVADADSLGVRQQQLPERSNSETPIAPHDGDARWPARPGEPQHEWEPPRALEPRVGRGADGLPRGMDRSRLKALGNAVVPQVVEAIGRAIVAVEVTS